MANLNPFRVSFDDPLGSPERTRARVAATVVGGAAIFLGATSLVAFFNASSAAVGTWPNTQPPAAVRILATDAEDPSGKPCADQTWPHIESRCLKPADPRETARSTPKHGLGSQQVALPAAPGANAPSSEIGLAPEPSKTGAAVLTDKPEPMSADTPEPRRTFAVPIPIPAPGLSAPVKSE